MALPVYTEPDPSWDADALAATRRYLVACDALRDRSYWPVKMTAALNLFYWHLDAFQRDEDPVPPFTAAFNRAAEFLEAAAASGICGEHFSPDASADKGASAFEADIAGLFQDVWVGLSDEVYFEETYRFTRERMEKNGIDPEDLFRDRVVVDAGCGSGKYAAAIARFGAAKVIGLDIGDKGLAFARAQAAKVPYGDRLEYRAGSLLDMPIDDGAVDMVWSNGVIHHTLDYERCLAEFARVLKPGGLLYLYVDGRMGLWEMMCDTFVAAHREFPRRLFQHFLTALGINSGRVYWIMDCLFAPYERKSAAEVEALLVKNGFEDPRRLMRGLDIDPNEMVAVGAPYAEVKYGEGTLKYLATKG